MGLVGERHGRFDWGNRPCAGGRGAASQSAHPSRGRCGGRIDPAGPVGGDADRR